MLYEFLTKNKEEILARSQKQIASTLVPLVMTEELARAVPLCVAHFEELLRRLEDPSAAPPRQASPHGQELQALGFTLSQAVHSYGTLWQVVADVLAEHGEITSAVEYQRLSGGLDVAIAETVSAYEAAHDASTAGAAATEHLGSLAQELRHALVTAMTLSEILASGHVGFGGRTANLLGRAHARMRGLIDKSLAEVRLRTTPEARPEALRVSELLDDIATTARVDAKQRGVELQLGVDTELEFQADRQLLVAAVANLVETAIGHSRPGGRVEVRARAADDWLRIEVHDLCGGAAEDPSRLSGGVPVALQAVRVQGGRIQMRTLAGQGCVFSVELPRRLPSPQAPALVSARQDAG